MEEFLKQLNISERGNKSNNGVYVIDLDGSDDYGRIYSKLDKSDIIEEVPESSQITYETSFIQFENDDFVVTLIADYENDNYKMTIKEI